jgi:acid phosphatase class B
VPSYLVETYLAHGDADERAARGRRASSAAEELTREQTPVRYEQSIHLPKDEICFFVFQAPTCLDAAHAARRAGLDALRIVEAVSSTPPPLPPQSTDEIEESS